MMIGYFFKATVICLCSAISTVPALAQQISQDQSPAREVLGWGRFITNDYFGDGQDRWRSSSYTLSRLTAPEGMENLPHSFGMLREFRIRADNITPASLANPAPDDRRYAGVLSFGLHSHFLHISEEISLGADLVLIGPQTGLSAFQNALHNKIGLPDGSASYNSQFADTARIALTAELGRPVALGDGAMLRPFVEGQLGIETLARAGVDFTFGAQAKGGILLRDATTGQRYSAVTAPQHSGLSFTFGGDIAYVSDSFYLPKTGIATLSPTRSRLRAGVNWQSEKVMLFLGMTYLSPEFDQQPTGQTLGSLSVIARF
jgi:hypothetical protein